MDVCSAEGMGAAEITRAIARGQLSAQEVAQETIVRIRNSEAQIHAWVGVDEDGAMGTARAIDAGNTRGLLAGVPIGIKDIIDVAGLPTQHGSAIYRADEGRVADADAACVALCRDAGGVIMGKTVTTEFAYFQPGPTANPHNLAHTPGGSSSGSAAAVAAGMVPVALGSQTAGSLIRPASYCGIWALKPSYGLLSLAGVKGMSQSLDTLGLLARNVEDLALMWTALLRLDRAAISVSATQGSPAIEDTLSGRTPRVGVWIPDWKELEPSSRKAVEGAAQALEHAGARVEPLRLPAECEQLTQAQRIVQAFEAARALSFERVSHADQLSPSIRALFDQGLSCPYEDYLQALALASQCRRQLAQAFHDIDAVLAPSAPGPAPKGLDATGDPLFSRMWNLLHLPSVNVPFMRTDDNLPIGVQLIAGYGKDTHLLNVAAWTELVLA